MQDNVQIHGVFRLATEPELRSLASGTSLASLRVAWNNAKKNSATGEWEDVGNFMNATVWGRQGEAAVKHLRKGSRVHIIGRMEHRTWEQDGKNREAHQIVVEKLQYLDPKEDSRGGGGFTPRSDVPVDTSDFGTSQSSGPVPADDDIPF